MPEKGLLKKGVLQVECWVLASMRHRVFHDLASLNAVIAAAVEAFNDPLYSDGSGECRRTRFEVINRPDMKPSPAVPWRRRIVRVVDLALFDAFRDSCVRIIEHIDLADQADSILGDGPNGYSSLQPRWILTTGR